MESVASPFYLKSSSHLKNYHCRFALSRIQYGFLNQKLLFLVEVIKGWIISRWFIMQLQY